MRVVRKKNKGNKISKGIHGNMVSIKGEEMALFVSVAGFIFINPELEVVNDDQIPAIELEKTIVQPKDGWIRAGRLDMEKALTLAAKAWLKLGKAIEAIKIALDNRAMEPRDIENLRMQQVFAISSMFDYYYSDQMLLDYINFLNEEAVKVAEFSGKKRRVS